MQGRFASEFLVVAVGVLSAIGLVVLFSITELSAARGQEEFQKQLMWLGIGLLFAVVAALVDYRVWQNWVWPLFWLSAFLLALCFAPMIGWEIKGANRWINARIFGVPALQFQPSEFARLAAVIFLAAWYHRRADKLGSSVMSFFAPGLCVALIVGLIGVEVDLGSAAVLSFTVGVVMLMAGVKFRWLISSALLAGGALAYTVWNLPERMGRFLAFLEPAKYPKDAFQQEQSVTMLGCGGWHGVGLGQRANFVSNLPEADTDFIFAVAGGELGLQVSLLIVLAYVLIMVCGMIIAFQAPDRFGMLLGVGVVSLIVIQAVINMGVVTMALPNKGLALPFVSRGGTNLVACMTGVGLLISIHRQGWRESLYTEPRLTRARITPAV